MSLSKVKSIFIRKIGKFIIISKFIKELLIINNLVNNLRIELDRLAVSVEDLATHGKEKLLLIILLKVL